VRTLDSLTCSYPFLILVCILVVVVLFRLVMVSVFATLPLIPCLLSTALVLVLVPRLPRTFTLVFALTTSQDTTIEL